MTDNKPPTRGEPPPQTTATTTTLLRPTSTLNIATKRSSEQWIEHAEIEDYKGGPQKCGLLFHKYWVGKGKRPDCRIPEVDVKFKVYRLSSFDQKAGTFYCDFVLMLDWIDESLSLVPDGEVPDFKNHFWPKAELMNMVPGEEDINFDEYLPKYKKDNRTTSDPAMIHRAAITIKVRRTLFCRLDYHAYPFDQQVLELSIKMLSVRIPLMSEETGTRPTVRHPTRFRGTDSRGNTLGHEMIPDADWLPEFQLTRLASKCYSSKFGPFASAKKLPSLIKALQKEKANACSGKEYYQDMYCLQLIMARDSKSVLWNLCFPLLVIDVMVFTAHGIPIEDLADRLSVTLTLLLTAMAFKWVLNDATPNVPYLTVMEMYVVSTFVMLFLQGLSFWFMADVSNYRCGAKDHYGEVATYIDWWTGAERFGSTNQTAIKDDDGGSASFFFHENICEHVHFADRVVLFLEIFAWMAKNFWFLSLLINRDLYADWFQCCYPCCRKRCGRQCSKMTKDTGFQDLSHLKGYSGEHHKHVGHEQQIEYCNILPNGGQSLRG